jgi:hypothetical protein
MPGLTSHFTPDRKHDSRQPTEQQGAKTISERAVLAYLFLKPRVAITYAAYAQKKSGAPKSATRFLGLTWIS